MRARGVSERHNEGVMREDVALCDGEVEVEHIEELALDAADVPFAEDTSAERPVHVFECGVIQVLQWMRMSGREGEITDEEIHTLLARMTAPRKTRSWAHCSRAI